MSKAKSRREAIKMSLGVLVGLPAVAALNACTQCSKPAGEAPSTPSSTTSDASPTDATAQGTTPETNTTAATGGATGGDTLTLVSETDPMATGLTYKHDKANVPAELQQEKSGVPFAEQSCSNCMFYKTAGQIEGNEVGTCQLIAAGKVKSAGWCNSWAKKA
jgi:hypothetical protein